MLTRVWQKLNSTSTWQPKVEEHSFSNGEVFYSFRDRFGRPSDISSHEEAMRIVKDWGMTEVTEEYRAEGWIA